MTEFIIKRMFNFLSPSSIPRWFFALVPYKIGEGLAINLLPLFIVQVAGGSVNDVAIVNSLTALAGVAAFTIWGNLSDKIKRRRPFLLLGFIGFCLCTILIALAQNFNQVLGACILEGFLMAAVTPQATALVIDSVSEYHLSRYFGNFYLLVAWSFVVAVILGSVWLAIFSGIWGVAFAMRGLLFLAAAIASLSIVFALMWIRESKTVNSRRPFIPSLLGILSVAVIERRVLFYPARLIYYVMRPEWLTRMPMQLKSYLSLYYVCCFAFFLSIQIIFVPFPIFLNKVFQASNTQIFLISFGKSFIEACFYLPMSRLVQQKNTIKIQAVATGVRICTFFNLFLLSIWQPTPVSLLIVGLLQLLNGLSWSAITVSNSISIARLARKGQEGVAIGVYNSTIGIATVIGSILSGYLAVNYGYSFCFATGSILTAGTAITLWWLSSVWSANRPEPS